MPESERVLVPFFAAETASFVVESENHDSDIGPSPLNSGLSSLNPGASERPAGRRNPSGAIHMSEQTLKALDLMTCS